MRKLHDKEYKYEEEYEGLKTDKICLFKENAKAQSVVETCQLFMHHKWRIFVEKKKSSDFYYTCFISHYDLGITGFVDMTSVFKKRLIDRLKQGNYLIDW
jgi:hypothetical protein